MNDDQDTRSTPDVPSGGRPETELAEAYGRLSAPVPLVGSTDPVGRSLARIRRRRQVRRGVAGTTALAAVAVVGVVLVARGGPGSVAVDDQDAAGPGASSQGLSTLTLTRGDGTAYRFEAAELGVACTGPADDPLLVVARADLIDAVVDGTELDEDQVGRAPLFYAEVRVDRVRAGRTFTLPFSGPAGSGQRPMVVFAAFDDGAARPNEISSDEGDAAGTVTIRQASCGADPRVSLEVDGVLGSEVRQPPRALRGEYVS